ncbi:MAG: hypothetical protein V9F82_09325 [Dermatophilaceae bacterium]
MTQAAVHARIPRPGARRTPLRAVPAAIGRTRSGLFALLCLGLLAGGLVTLLMLNTALAQGSFTVAELTASSGELTDQTHALRQSVESVSNSTALARRASELGMVPSKSMAFLRLSDGAILGVADPAKAEPFVLVATPRPPPPAPAVETAAAPAPAAVGAAPTAATPPGSPTAPTAAPPPGSPTAPAPSAPGR